MENLKRMESLDEYNLFTEGGDDYIEPHVVYIPSSNLVKYKRIRKVTVGDIVYFNGTKIKTIEPNLYNVNLGYPLGVIAIPPDMLPDGKARYCTIYCGQVSQWGPSDVDTPLQNHEWFPVFNEYYPDGIGLSGGAYLPSDYYNGTRSADDPKAFYNEYPYGEFGPCICPSPYLGDDYTLNPKYITENFSNVFTDLDGLSNTRTLIGLGNEYQAAHLANSASNDSDWMKGDIDYLNGKGLINYNSDLLNIETYLPSVGELGFVVARYKRIKQSMEIIAKEINDNWGWKFNNIFSDDLSEEKSIWSSTEMYKQDYPEIRITHNYVYVGRTSKDSGVSRYVLPFIILE